MGVCGVSASGLCEMKVKKTFLWSSISLSTMDWERNNSTCSLLGRGRQGMGKDAFCPGSKEPLCHSSSTLHLPHCLGSLPGAGASNFPSQYWWLLEQIWLLTEITSRIIAVPLQTWPVWHFSCNHVGWVAVGGVESSSWNLVLYGTNAATHRIE